MEAGLVTVVIPVYNTEKYLNRCVESVVNQTYRNLEILLIDDGSPDGCPGMCDSWAQKDARVRVIHKANAGLGMARNTGIENASGEYICFFDSDDYIAPDTIEKSYARACAEQAEVVHFGFHSVNAEGKVVSSFASPVGDAVFRGEEVCNVFLPDLITPDPKGSGQRQYYMSACMMLFSVAAIRRAGWSFVSEREIVSEDVYSLLELFRYIHSVAILPEALYFYCANSVSLSRKYVPGRYERIRHFYQESLALCERLEYGQEIRHRVSKPYLSFAIAAMKQEMTSPRAYGERMAEVKRIVDDPVLQEVLRANRKDHVSITRRVLFWTVRNKRYTLCGWLLLLKS